jgi:photosystem II stability/assembly factor-like uncharacterized protein
MDTYPLHHLRSVLGEIQKRERELALSKTGRRAVGDIRNWVELGPGNIGGRTRALVIDPVAPDTMHAGGVAGGIWKTVDGGASWTAADDSMINLAITTMAINPIDTRVLYAGTGEGFFWSGMVRGLGIFKSVDAGESWHQLESTVKGVPEGAFRWVNDIVISPNNPDTLYAATRTGVWRSIDAGESWDVALANPLFIEGEQSSGGCYLGATELAIRGDRDPDVVFAAFGSIDADGLYRSEDGGDSWQKLPLGDIYQGRMALAIAPSNNDIIYVSMAQNNVDTYGKLRHFYRSIDGGDSWEERVDFASDTGRWLLSSYAMAAGCFDYPVYHQGWYDNVVAVDPLDPDIVWVGGVNLFRSDDGGRTFLIGEGPLMSPRSNRWDLHVDHHALVFHPEYDGVSNQTLFVGNDGGLARTDVARAAAGTDICNPNGFVFWRDLNNSYAVTQFYHGDSAKDRDVFVGGTQDNGTNMAVGTDSPDAWNNIYWGDGGYVAIDPTDSTVMFIEIQGFPEILRSTDAGTTFVPAVGGILDTDGLFITPFAMDQSNPSYLWTGGTRPWRTDNSGDSWRRVGYSTPRGGQISAVAIAPSDGSDVYLGYSSGVVARTTNGYDDEPDWELSTSSLPLAFISSIAIDHTDPEVAYCTISTFGFPHVYKTIDGGMNWRPIDGEGKDRIPDIPAHWIVIRPGNPRQLYVATELGVFASDNGGLRWYPANFDLPHTVVESFDFKDDDTLVAFTHGRGVWLAELGEDATPRQPIRRVGQSRQARPGAAPSR